MEGPFIVTVTQLHHNMSQTLSPHADVCHGHEYVKLSTQFAKATNGFVLFLFL
jgi:hypothetical protein